MHQPLYKPEQCQHCSQTTTYLLPVDRGASVIMVAMSAAIRKKRLNAVHGTKEMMIPAKEWSMDMAREGFLTVNHIRNLGRVRIHGLIASVKGARGSFCLTPKGAQFLKGQDIPKYAIRSKSQKKTIGYFEPDKYRTTIQAEMAKLGSWEGIDYDIVDGHVVMNLPVPVRKVEMANQGKML